MKTVIGLVLGIGSGLALAYFLDPKGSKKKLQKIEKEIKKNRSKIETKLDHYKETYDNLVHKYVTPTMENAKGAVDKMKNTVAA